MYNRFYDFDLSEEMLDSISNMGFVEPTQIQKLAIPPIMNGEDIIGVAQTGTGKTASFGIPIIEKDVNGKSKTPFSLVLVPTRELAIQVVDELNRIGKHKSIVATAIYGGQSIELQIKSLKKHVDIVVGTPGRTIDHILRQTLILSSVSTVVLDEADEMLNMGFIDDIETILIETPQERQTLLFSATMPEQIVRISKKYMLYPKKVYVDTKEPVVEKIRQEFYEVKEKDKLTALTRIFDVHKPPLSLVFCHMKRDVDEFTGKLKDMGYRVGGIHGDYAQSFREEMMWKFKNNEINILLATDVAARGLDIKNVSHVINFSMPQNPDSYIHRIGRTGRAGKSGIAITFVTPRDYSQLRLIEKIIKTKINKSKLPSVSEVLHARQSHIVGKLEDVIREGKHREFLPLVESILEKYGHGHLAAAALSLSVGEFKVEPIEEITSRFTPARQETPKKNIPNSKRRVSLKKRKPSPKQYQKSL
ncbi:DEAD/DEAH box helicase [Candidatus Magnetoovum chiemensis]|nr:DEAD/DEAH box helicase [Candidatus Magnetoovum chiemensis]